MLPGVTVEASSPALIEGTRVAVSDGDGNYRIADLRPGNYSVSFTLPGFNVYIRDEIELEGNAVLNVDGDMQLGALEESITVTGESAIVDVQSSSKEQVLTEELLNTIPTGRQAWNVGYTLPGVTLNRPGRVVGGAGGIQQVRMGVHGADQNETTIEIDGMQVNANHGNGSTQQYFNQNMTQQMSFTTSANSAETQKGGVRLNMIPQTGGNTFSGTFLAVAVPSEDFVSNNFTQELKDAGLRTPNRPLSTSDYNASVGRADRARQGLVLRVVSSRRLEGDAGRLDVPRREHHRRPPVDPAGLGARDGERGGHEQDHRLFRTVQEVPGGSATPPRATRSWRRGAGRPMAATTTWARRS